MLPLDLVEEAIVVGFTIAALLSQHTCEPLQPQKRLSFVRATLKNLESFRERVRSLVCTIPFYVVCVKTGVSKPVCRLQRMCVISTRG